MALLSPWMLFGALAAGIPIALHFFYRSRYRVVPWAAMEFLLTSIQQTSRRLKFQELLLLLLRCALLLLLALALARPTMQLFGGGRGESIDAVLIFDVSASMGAREGSKTRLERARAAALQVIDNLPPSSTVQIVTCADRSTLLGPRSPGNLDQARELIATITTTELATDFLPGFVEASKALERGHSPNREIYLFSDMQKLGWEQQAAALRTRLKDAHEKAQIYAVRCGTQKVRNAAIVGLIGQTGIPHVGERASFAVLVRNTGTEVLRDLTVSLTVDQRTADRDSQAIGLLNPGETRTVPVTAKLVRPGQQIITATVGPDDLDGDNRFDQVIQVRDQVRVLVVDGSPNQQDPTRSASFHLVNALQTVPDAKKADYYIQPRVVVPRLASAPLLQDKDLCILVDAPLRPSANNEGGHLSAEFLERLSSFVREGHGLIIFAGPHVEPDAYNQILEEKYGLLPLRLGKPYAMQGDKRLNFDINTASAQSYLNPSWTAHLSNVEIVQALDSNPLRREDEKGGSSRIDLCYTNGKPALATRMVGRGEVLLATTTADPRWNHLAFSIPYVPLLDSALGELLQSSVQAQNRVVGQAITWTPPIQEETRSHRLTLPSGDEIDLGYPRNENGQALLTVADTQRAGVYSIMPVAAEGREDLVTRPDGADRKESPGALFAVTPDLRETSDLATFSNKEIDEQAGVPVIHLIAGQEISNTGADRLSREWTVWLLAAVLALVLCETALAWFCGRTW
jgi:Aerotolerance regulator N-terminal/von Willebrand factor type A domain/CARDB